MQAEDTEISWTTWLDEFGPRLLLFARQQARHSSDAEDLLQEACLRVWKRVGAKAVVPPASHFFRAIRHAAIDNARSEDRRKARESRFGEPEEPESAFEHPLEASERNARIEEALRTLPEEQRQVLVLKVWGEQTFREIGEILDVSPDTAASRYRYALNHLREHLGEPSVP